MNIKTFLRRYCALALLLAASPAAQADDDFGIWAGVEAEKKINRQFSLNAGVNFRAEQKLQSVGRWGVSLGADYKPFKGLKFGAGYTWLYARSPQESKADYKKSGAFNGYNVDHGYWRPKHRAFFDVSGKVGIGRFTLGVRERYQFTHHMGVDHVRDRYRGLAPGGYDGPVYEWNGQQFVSFESVERHKSNKNVHYLRSRFSLEYDIRHCPVDPSVSYEFSNNLSDAMHLDKQRLYVGADWKISKKHVLSFGYIYQNGADDDGNDDIHVIDIGYKLKF